MTNIYTTDLYPVTLYFTREHTKGTLKGVFTFDKLPFVSVESADRWIKGVKKYEKRNGYRLADYSFQNYFRNGEIS